MSVLDIFWRRYYQAVFLRIFQKTNIRRDARKFDLFKTVDMDKLNMLQNGKVKEIRIKASAYKASASLAQRQDSALGVMGVITKYVRALCGAEHDVTNDSMRVELTLKTDKRSTQHLALGERRIEEIAEDILTNEQPGDEYAIELEDGGTISQNDLFVKSDVQITGHGKSVNKDETWNHLLAFYVGLERSRVIT